MAVDRRGPSLLLGPPRRYERLLELTHDLILSLSIDRRIVSLSPAFESMTGWTAGEWIGKPFSFLIHPDDRPRFVATTEALEEAAALPGVELRLLTKDGEPRVVDLVLILDHEPGHEPLFLGIARDLTERRRTAEALAHREAQLQQAQKMEAIGRLAGGIAHDFNNLLTIITGYTQLLLTRLRGADETVRGDVDEIRKAAVRAASLTQQLLAFSRRQTMTPKVLCLNAVVEGIEAMLQRLIGEDVHLTTALDPGVGQIKADPCQMEQVIMNLVVNARDAMPRGGRITIETRNVQVHDGHISVDGPLAPGAYVVLSIQDTGCGMDPATLARIFEPFFTTKGQGKGTGLGLASVYGTVKQSGGHVAVKSRPGEGTHFAIYLPSVDRVAEVPEAEQPAVLASGSETILLVEDEPTVRGLVRDTLRLFGYTVLEARHGFEAQVIGGQHAGGIDLLITDVVMPQMSGRELADALGHLHPKMKVLYMSGYTQSAMIDHGVLCTGTAFLQKPFSPEFLARKVRQTLDDRGPRQPANAS